MALRAAIANGNWSNPATWNAGVVPTVGDIIASNGFTVTIDQNINVDLLTNTVQSPVIITPVMTSNTTPSGIVTASGTFGGSFPAWAAFDRSFPNWLSNLPTGWVAYQFTSLKVVQIYEMVPPGNNAPASVPRNWTFEAWNGTSWVVLDTVTGNSGTATVKRTISNTTAYIQYRINISLNNGDGSYTGVTELRMYEANDYTINSVAGGGFILSGTFTVSATGGGFITGATRLLTYTGSNCVLNGNMIGSTTTNVQTVYHDSIGALTINGNVINTANPTVNVIVTNSTGTLNINGNIQGDGRGVNVFVNSVCTVNIVGNVTRFTNFSGGASVQINAGATVNITGISNNNAGGTGSPTIVVNSSSSILNVTGDVFFGGTQSSCSTITISQPGRVNVVGNVYNTGVLSFAIVSTTNGYLSIVGSIYTTVAVAAVLSNNASGINLFTGPFICSSYGFFPYQCVRMHLIPSASSYIEFRDETTNGAIAPGAIAPATRMISPASASDAPIASNVRFGTNYALGSQTGTLRIPHPNSVSFGIPVDNTFGTAALRPEDVWNYATSAMNTDGSIGKRIKNAATVQSTGDQLSASL